MKFQRTCFGYSPSESFQKVVKVSSNGKLMATGGCDGYLRLWQFPTFKPLRDIKAHEKEIDDLDFSPDCQKVLLNFNFRKLNLLTDFNRNPVLQS